MTAAEIEPKERCGERRREAEVGEGRGEFCC